MNEKDFYTYIIFDTRKNGEYVYDDLRFDFEPIYVGKGKHSSKKLRLETHFKSDKKNLLKANKILKIIEDTDELPLVKYYDIELTEQEALDQEKNLIDKIGRIVKETGPLTNIIDGGYCLDYEIHRERVNSLNYKKIISEKSKNNWNNEEYREKCIKKGYNHPMRRTVYLFDLNGTELKTFDFLKDCAIYLNTTSANICKVIDRKCSWKSTYYISYFDKININDYKIVKTKNVLRHKILNETQFFIFDVNGKLLNEFDSLIKVSDFFNLNSRIIRKKIHNKTSINEKYFISLDVNFNIKNFKLTKSINKIIIDTFKYDNNIISEKYCNRCNQYKNIELFGKNKNLKFGIGQYCKDCENNRTVIGLKDKFSQYSRIPKKFKFDAENKPIEKWCNKCKEFKSIDFFGNNKSMLYEKALYCKQCDFNRLNINNK